MVVNEIRNAVIDTVEFIIPPFAKLIIALIVANYVTSGILTQYLNEFTSEHIKAIGASDLKIVIDNLYLSSIVPILAILLIILIAYSINRISSFIGSLVPITYTSTTIIRAPYYASEIWRYFPQVDNLYELRLKVTQLLSLAKVSNVSLPFEQLKWQEEKMQTKFDSVNFINFLLLWSAISYFIVHRCLDTSVTSYRLIVTVFILVLLIVAMYFQIVQNELDIESAELMIVDSYLRINSEYKKTEDLEVLKQIERLLRTEQYYNKKWWSLSIGYRLDWVKMYKYYRPPFYWTYIKWKDRREIEQRRQKSD